MKDYKTDLEELLEYLIIRNYSKSTQDGYGTGVRQFFEWHKYHELPMPYTQLDVRKYILHRYSLGRKWQTINNDYSGIRILFQQVKGYKWDYWALPRPRKERYLPNILSKEQVLTLINSASFYKHQVMLSLYYSTGIRLSELLHLKIEDVDSDRRQIFIRKGKGAKDRYVDIPMKMIEELRVYYQVYRPVDYLFNGRYKGQPLSPRALQHGINGAKKRAGITKQASAHTLRHCYATHHLESGTDLVYLQKMLGHKHLKTTAKYIHLCHKQYRNVNHPIEELNIQFRRK